MILAATSLVSICSTAVDGAFRGLQSFDTLDLDNEQRRENCKCAACLHVGKSMKCIEYPFLTDITHQLISILGQTSAYFPNLKPVNMEERSRGINGGINGKRIVNHGRKISQTQIRGTEEEVENQSQSPKQIKIKYALTRHASYVMIGARNCSYVSIKMETPSRYA